MASPHPFLPLFFMYILLLLVWLVSGCGAKTGLLVLDAEMEQDADVGEDADPEVSDEPCIAEAVQIDRLRAQMIVVIDRSESMFWTLDGRYPEWGESSRWELLAEALTGALLLVEDFVEVGAEFYPRFLPSMPLDGACDISPGLDVRPGPRSHRAVMSVFDETHPIGGTPTAPAVAEARDYFVAHELPGIARFVLLATDGGPNCRDAPPEPPSSCICTGSPEVYCPDPADDYMACLDDERSLEVMESTFSEHHIPVFVVGIDDPTRPDLALFLDTMAQAGGRPRQEPSLRRFYSVQREGDLEEALGSIVGSIARCIFAVSLDRLDTSVEVTVDGVLIPRDPGHGDGWDWTNLEAGEMTFFGSSCDLAGAQGAEVEGFIPCAID